MNPTESWRRRFCFTCGVVPALGFPARAELGDDLRVDLVLVVHGLVTARPEDGLAQPGQAEHQQEGTDHDAECVDRDVADERDADHHDEHPEDHGGRGRTLESRAPAPADPRRHDERERLDHLDQTRPEDGEDEDEGRGGVHGRSEVEITGRRTSGSLARPSRVVFAALTCGSESKEAVAMAEAPPGAATGRNYVVVSADTHASPDSLEHFLSYVDPKDREAVAAFGDMSSLAISMFGGFDPGDVDESDPVRATAARRLAGMGVDIDAAAGWLAHYGVDWVVPGDGGGRRLEVLEEQGIHAEVTLPGPILAGGLSPAMYLGAQTDKGLEVVWPALHGYLRWLVDFCAAAPGRRAGCMPIHFHDMDRAVEEVAWARANGIFGGVMLPAMSVGSRLPGYADEYYEPFWSACEEHGMVVNLHTGASGSATDTKFLYDPVHGGMLGLYEVFVFTRRPLWFLIFGGVFDRHPDLKVVVTENGVQWLPSLVRDMESFFDTHGGAPVRSYLKMRPRDYFERHVWLGGSLMKRYEAEMRDEIGLDRLMWGADYPHLEGAAPVHRDTLRYIFGGLPEDDIRRMLGTNAVSLWGFDGDLLQSVADRVGPTVEDLAQRVALEQIDDTFSWSLARPVPLSASR